METILRSALVDVEEAGNTEVPDHLKDAHRDRKALGHGEGYKYPHSYPGHYVKQQYLPDELQGRRYYAPSEQGYEREIKKRIEEWRKRGNLRGVGGKEERSATSTNTSARTVAVRTG